MDLREKLIALGDNPLQQVGETGVFVKTLTVSEYEEFLRLQEQYDDDFAVERNFAFEVFDDKGERIFNPHDLNDLEKIKKMPARFVIQVLSKSKEVNDSDFFSMRLQQNASLMEGADSSLN